MKISNIDMKISYKSVECGIFSMNSHISSERYNKRDMKTESTDAFRFFIQMGLYG